MTLDPTGTKLAVTFRDSQSIGLYKVLLRPLPSLIPIKSLNSDDFDEKRRELGGQEKGNKWGYPVVSWANKVNQGGATLGILWDRLYFTTVNI